MIRPRSIGAILGGLLAARSVAAQAPAMRPDFRVNSETINSQDYPAVAASGDGRVIVAWRSNDGLGDGVWVRVFLTDGTPLSGDVAVNAYTTGDQNLASVAADDTGHFVVTWSTFGDGDQSGIAARRFSNVGVPLGDQFPVNTFTTGFQNFSDVAMRGSGEFVVVWQDLSSTDVHGQRFDAAGAPAGSEFTINTFTTAGQGFPRVAMDPSGTFVVVWAGGVQDGNEFGVFGQRYDPSGGALGPEFQVNVFTTGSQSRPDVAVDPSGNFVVAWQSENQDVSGYSVLGRRYDSSGNPAGEEFRVSAYPEGDQKLPRVGMSPLGDFTVAWQSPHDDPAGSASIGIFAQRFDADGRRAGGEFTVNTYTTGDQAHPDVVVDEAGQFLAVWDGFGTGDAVSGNGGAFARAGGLPDPRAGEVDARAAGSAPSVSNVNGVLETGETVAVDTSWRNSATTPILLGGAATSFTGPPGPVYTLDDGFAGYGTIDPGATANCYDTTGNCYQVTVTGARPSAHWDATLDETFFNGATKTWTLHLGESFADVPLANQFYAFVENIFHNGITAGGSCGGYCPSDSTLRQQMAVFVLKSKEGSSYSPPPATGVFNDVPAADPFAPWIEELFRRGVVAGCATPGGPNYCPDDAVLRQQMAVFLLRTLEGSSYVPPVCTGIFPDVPCPGTFTDWIEDLFGRSIAAGCGGGNYCPTSPTNRGQMAPFLVKTFGLELYGP